MIFCMPNISISLFIKPVTLDLKRNLARTFGSGMMQGAITQRRENPPPPPPPPFNTVRGIDSRGGCING